MPTTKEPPQEITDQYFDTPLSSDPLKQMVFLIFILIHCLASRPFLAYLPLSHGNSILENYAKMQWSRRFY